MDGGAAFVAQSKTPVLVEPGEGALDDTAFAAEARAVLGVAGLAMIGLIPRARSGCQCAPWLRVRLLA